MTNACWLTAYRSKRRENTNTHTQTRARAEWAIDLYTMWRETSRIIIENGDDERWVCDFQHLRKYFKTQFSFDKLDAPDPDATAHSVYFTYCVVYFPYFRADQFERCDRQKEKKLTVCHTNVIIDILYLLAHIFAFVRQIYSFSYSHFV